MKILVAVTNCWMYRKRQEAIRNTWLKDVPEHVDVKFFLGRPPAGTPTDGSVKINPDEIIVDVDDSYTGLPAKTREMCRYALKNGYTHLFKTDDDVYVQLGRLVAANSRDLGDYVGRKRGPSGVWPAPYASGFSYWLSQRAMNLIAEAKLTDDPAEDRWVGNTLLSAGMGCVGDYRYVVTNSTRNSLSYNEGPRKGNPVITACEFETEREMFVIHNNWLNVKSLSNTHQKIDAPCPLRKVSVVLKTFLRDGYLIRAVEGIKKNLPECKIVIVDDGYESRHKISMYAQLRLEGHDCSWLPFDSGFGAKANEAIKYCDREYVLIGSDDFAFGQTNVRADVIRMVQTLEDTDLDVVSGRVNGTPYEATLHEDGDSIVETRGYHGEDSCEAGAYKRCDLTVNYSLIRRSLLDQVRWDNDVKIGGGEHGAFFLDIKRAGGKVAYLPDVVINELPPNMAGWQHVEYPTYRNRARQQGRACLARRGIKTWYLQNGQPEATGL